MTENLSEERINVMKSDNGGEHTKDSFHDFCLEARSKGSFLFPTTHRKMWLQNGKTKQYF